MAHVTKVKQTGVVGLAIHNERRAGCELSNRDIDSSRTHLNYNLAASIQPLRPEAFLKQRLKEISYLKRKDVVMMADWIVTLPKDVKQGDEQLFFESCYDFLEKMYGKQNVVSAWVHNDETTPHIHFSFIPVLQEENRERLNCKKILTKTALKQFHPALCESIEKRLGYLPSIQNGATINGNRTIQELKSQEDLSFKKSVDNIKTHINASEQVVQKADNINLETTNALDKIKALSQASKVIDELKASNQLLQVDNQSLINLAEIQKKEIDMYRQMPLAKQLKESKDDLIKIKEIISSAANSLKQSEMDLRESEIEKNTLHNRISTLEKELSIHNSFLAFLGFESIFKKFKKAFLYNDYSLPLGFLREMCSKAAEKLIEMTKSLFNLDQQNDVLVKPAQQKQTHEQQIR